MTQHETVSRLIGNADLLKHLSVTIS